MDVSSSPTARTRARSFTATRASRAVSTGGRNTSRRRRCVVARRQQQADRALRPAMPLAGPAVPCQARGARALAADRPWPAQRGRRAALPTVLDTVPAPRPATFSAPTAAARPPGPAPTASPGPSSPSRPPAGDARPPSTPRPSATSATPAKNGATTATPPAPESDSAAPAPHCQEPVTPHRPPRQPPGGPHAANLTPPEVGNFGEQSWGLSASGIRMRSPRSNRRVAAGESLRGGVVAVRPSTHCRPGGPSSLKTAKDVMDIVNACEATGTYPGPTGLRQCLRARHTRRCGG